MQYLIKNITVEKCFIVSYCNKLVEFLFLQKKIFYGVE